MKQSTVALDPDLLNADISEELKQEIALFRRLRPYLGHCLTMNHDINNSLSGILGYAEFLLDSAHELTDEQRSNLDMIVTCAERVKDLVENLCEHKLSLIEEIDLQPVIETYRKVARPLD